jgi:pimeloyl-ACP methyl ester carboxylesterase
MPESSPATAPPYTEPRPATDRWVDVRGLRYHLRCWGNPAQATPERPPLVLMHGWMDVAASFQFMVDALHAIEGPGRTVVAADWRGFGLTDTPSADSYWFPDYLADLDALLDIVLAESPAANQVDLLGHSMGGNVVMSYAALRPQRIRRLVNLEGFGLPRTEAAQAPQRLLQWLDELKAPAQLRDYDSVQAVAERLMKNNPLLPADKAAWLAPHWARPGPDGRWQILGDPAHKRVNPVLYQVDEVLATWRLIQAPVLWVEGDQTDVGKWWGKRYPRAEFETRLAVVPYVRRAMLSPCGHMLHHDQPEALARTLVEHLA